MSNPIQEHAVFHSAGIAGLEDFAIYKFPSKQDAEAWMIKVIRDSERKVLHSYYDDIPDAEVIEEFQSGLEPMDYFHCYPIKSPEVL